jgi:hypothetical protein
MTVDDNGFWRICNCGALRKEPAGTLLPGFIVLTM